MKWFILLYSAIAKGNSRQKLKQELGPETKEKHWLLTPPRLTFSYCSYTAQAHLLRDFTARTDGTFSQLEIKKMLHSQWRWFFN